MQTIAPSCRCHRYPADSSVQWVRLSYRFSLSYRAVAELLFERGVIVSYESIRRWCHTFGPCFAAAIRRRRPQPQDKWHLDEMFIKMNGRTYDLWRAVDADGMVLDILVQERRNQEAAETFLRRLVADYPDEPRMVVTDTLTRSAPAIKEVLLRAEHRQHKGLNHRVENLHQPTRQGERAMRRFKSPEQAQRFLEQFGPIRAHFCPGRHRLSGSDHRVVLVARFVIGRDVTGVAA